LHRGDAARLRIARQYVGQLGPRRSRHSSPRNAQDGRSTDQGTPHLDHGCGPKGPRRRRAIGERQTGDRVDRTRPTQQLSTFGVVARLPHHYDALQGATRESVGLVWTPPILACVLCRRRGRLLPRPRAVLHMRQTRPACGAARSGACVPITTEPIEVDPAGTFFRFIRFQRCSQACYDHRNARGIAHEGAG
jgi:hypothetical protein